MANVTVSLEGADELQAAIQGLRRAARGTVLERAALAGAEVIRDSAARRAPGPHIELETIKQADHAVLVGIGPDKDHWYYGFFETGTTGHPIKPETKEALVFAGHEGPEVRIRVDHPGMDAAPFLRPAIDESKSAATMAAGDELRRGIERVARG